METRAQIEACAHATHSGTRPFGETVRALIDAGVEGYHVDYRARRTAYYLPRGEAHSVALPFPVADIAEQLDTSALQALIRSSQRGELRYPEFVARSMEAGCIGYYVFFSGRHVAYFGRDGSQHIERFPS